MKTKKTPKDVTGDGKFTYADVLKMRGVNVDKKNLGGFLGMAGSLMGGASPMGMPTMGASPLMGAFSQLLNPIASAYGQKLANRINPGSTPADELPKAYGGMKVKKGKKGKKGKKSINYDIGPAYSATSVDRTLADKMYFNKAFGSGLESKLIQNADGSYTRKSVDSSPATPKAKNGMKRKEPDYQGAVPAYNTRNVDPVLDQILGMLTRDMDKMKPKRAARVKKKADLQGQTPEKFLKNRALMRILMGAAAGAAAPQMGNRTSMLR